MRSGKLTIVKIEGIITSYLCHFVRLFVFSSALSVAVNPGSVVLPCHPSGRIWGQSILLFVSSQIIFNFADRLMRVLLVNTSEHTGGASIAAKRLMKALNHNGVEAQMLVRDRLTDQPGIVALPPSPLVKARFIMERAEIFIANHFSKTNLFAIDHASHGNDITRLQVFKEADVIHLHWVNQGMLSLSDVSKIMKSGKPVVWTLHDMWACTGVCHQADTCEGWLKGCGHCPLLKGDSANDLSHKTYLRKQRLYQEGNIQFVTCSDWLADICRRAPLLKGQSVVSIPNPIDTDRFSPGDKVAARLRLGLPLDKKVLLFVAYKATDKNKGIDYLLQAVDILRQRDSKLADQLCMVPVGREAESLRHRFACETFPTEYVSDEDTMLDLYNAADVLTMPTLMDNLPNTIVEAMACGVPCVGSNVGGLPQMITSGVDGYLARLRDAEDFAEGIVQVAFSPDYSQMAEAARRKAIEAYSENAVARRFIDIYNQVR